MFVLSHSDVRANGTPEPCVCSTGTILDNGDGIENRRVGQLHHCQCGKMECVSHMSMFGKSSSNLVCHKDGGMFK